jgi:dGTPase
MAIFGKRLNVLGYLPSPFYKDEDAARQHEEPPHKDEKRQTFEIDKARIIHSGAFRRLQAKTQVLGVWERDFYRTRLTHSMEVAQLGRGLCREAKNPDKVQIDPELVEAVCLAHDIGHPPFGHSGERCLHLRMVKHGGFGANPQNLRIVTFLEQKHPEGGLNLCRAMLDGLIKYSDIFSEKEFSKSSNFTYRDHEKLLNWIKNGRSEKSIECQIADWADAAAYSVDDIEDSLRAGVLDLNEVKKRAGEISGRVRERLEGDGVKNDPSVTSREAIVKEAEELQSILMSRTFADRKRRLKGWTSGTITNLLKSCEIVERNKRDSSNRYRYGLCVPDKARCIAVTLKAIVKILVFDDPRVVTLEAKGGFILEQLFDVFIRNHKLLPLDFQEYIKQKTDSPERLIADFIAGMTDRYAAAYYRRLFEPGAGSFYEDV